MTPGYKDMHREEIAAFKSIAAATKKLHDIKIQSVFREPTERLDKNGRAIYTGMRVRYTHSDVITIKTKIGKIYRSTNSNAGSLTKFTICFDDGSQRWLGLIPNRELEIVE